MASLDFPSSPTNGQQYTLNGITYYYDSTVGAWLTSVVATTFDIPTLFSVSNASYGTANAAFEFANGVSTNTTAAFAFANGVAVNAAAAFAAGNAEFAFSNTIYAAVNSAFGVINAAYTSSNADYVLTNAAFTVTNAAFGVANNAYTATNGAAAFAFANGVATNTTAAFAKANAALANTTTTLNGTLTTTGGITVESDLSIKKVSETTVALGNSGTAITINIGTGTVFTCTLTGSCTFTLSNVTSSKAASFSLILTNDATAGRSVAWSGGTFRYPGGSVSRTTGANAIDIWTGFTPDGGTTWYLNIPMKNIS
jgi:hypothetical protein